MYLVYAALFLLVVSPNAAEETTLHSAAQSPQTSNVPATVQLVSKFDSRPPTPKPPIIPEYMEKAESRPVMDDFLFVDKTNFAHRLCEPGGKYFFVRPRRFGKSTFLRTLEAIFDGRGPKILNGTSIHRSTYSWKPYPVLYMDLGQYVIETEKSCRELKKTPDSLTLLARKLDEIFTEFKTDHGLLRPKEPTLPAEFRSILKEIGKEKKNETVVLIDEYDFSILNNMVSCPEAAETNKELVRDIFLQLKEGGAPKKLVFVTGISEATFSILGGAFDLQDITDDAHYHAIAGLTDADLAKYYGDHYAETYRMYGKSNVTINRELKQWYNGYNFSAFPPAPLYNPLSVHNYLQKGSARGYWGDRNHAQFLFQQMLIRPIQFSLDLKYGTRSRLQGSRTLSETDAALLYYDAGYITIAGFEDGDFILKFPNKEMEEAWENDMAEAALLSKNSTETEIGMITRALKQKPVPDFAMFMYAINRGLMKLAIRAPFEEWYSWQSMLLMKKAQISHASRETKYDTIGRKNKYIDITACSDEIYFLIECKYNRNGNSDAWAAARESIPSFLRKNMKAKKPLNLLAAGITFTSDFEQNVVSAYQAKLIDPNGTVSEIWDSEDPPNENTNFYKEANYTYDPAKFTPTERKYTTRRNTTRSKPS